MSYADYTYYSGTFLGTAISASDFDALALRASAWIDRLTYDRAEDDEDYTSEIKNAMCAVAEQLQTNDTEGDSDGIQSERIGSNSVTYATNSSRMLSNDKKIENAAKLYLASTGLMFKGFLSDE